MTKKQYVLVVMLMAFAGIIGGAVSNKLNSVPTTLAQSSSTRPRDATPRRKWEYCSVTKPNYAGSNRGGIYQITYFRDPNFEIVNVEEAATERGGPAKAIARLGEEGWEMVGQGALEVRQGGLNALYFKRLKP